MTASPRSAAGAAGVPFRPRNSRRLPLCAVTGSLIAWNAVHEANCGSKVFCARMTCWVRSNTVRTWCWVCSRRTPRLHSTYEVSVSRRTSGPVLVTRSRAIFTAAVLGDPEGIDRRDVSLDVLERRGARAMTDGVWRRHADRPRRRAPELAGVLVAQVEGLRHRIAGRIVVPRGEAEEEAVGGPGETAAALGDHEAAVRVGDDVGPRRRRHVVAADLDLVVAVRAQARRSRSRTPPVALGWTGAGASAARSPPGTPAGSAASEAASRSGALRGSPANRSALAPGSRGPAGRIRHRAACRWS